MIEAFKILIKDKYWVIFVITMICVVFMQTSLGMSNVYYFKRELHISGYACGCPVEL